DNRSKRKEVAVMHKQLNALLREKGKPEVPAPALKASPSEDGPVSAPAMEDFDSQVSKGEEDAKVAREMFKRSGGDPEALERIFKTLDQALAGQISLGESLEKFKQRTDEAIAELAVDNGELKAQFEQLRQDHNALAGRVTVAETRISVLEAMAGAMRFRLTPYLTGDGIIQNGVTVPPDIVLRSPLAAAIGGGLRGTAGAVLFDHIYVAGGGGGHVSLMGDWVRNASEEGLAPSYRIIGNLDLQFGWAKFPYITAGPFVSVGVQGHDALPHMARLTSVPITVGLRMDVLIPINNFVGFTISPYVGVGGDIHSTDMRRGGQVVGPRVDTGPVLQGGISIGPTFGWFGAPWTAETLTRKALHSQQEGKRTKVVPPAEEPVAEVVPQ
ncbi:MAG: hypothetical protein Q8R28_00310, partial [Dehalococcoidia bacterium]|nr:hypothetical protein [Dehalococcoidia bacterium]